jgi:DNA repair exonuclease SbcCD ATPase subunit
MLLHKLHIHEWRHILSVLGNDLSRFQNNYTYQASDNQALKKHIEKIKQAITYLEKTNTFILENETQLSHIKKQILSLEATSDHEQKELNENKSYFGDHIPKLLKSIQFTEYEFKQLASSLDVIDRELSGNIEPGRIQQAKTSIQRLQSAIETIEAVSRTLSQFIKTKHKHIRLEIANLKEEDNIIHHFDHNIESWFMH